MTDCSGGGFDEGKNSVNYERATRTEPPWDFREGQTNARRIFAAGGVTLTNAERHIWRVARCRRRSSYGARIRGAEVLG
jgi:hypothetical protein